MEFRSEPTVELIDWMPRVNTTGDQSIAQAARVSSGTEGDQRNTGLLRMLMRDRHGSPFEHVVFTWRIETPIFVAREFMRHRIASYNETSARYRELEPVFYVPGPDRPLVQEGKPGAYTFTAGTSEQYEREANRHRITAYGSWVIYKEALADGIAREVARDHLSFNIFTSFYVTMNLRSLLNFLSLRWAHEDASTPTFPLYEIEQVAKLMEADATPVVPEVFKNFNANGRIAP